MPQVDEAFLRSMLLHVAFPILDLGRIRGRPGGAWARSMGGGTSKQESSNCRTRGKLCELATSIGWLGWTRELETIETGSTWTLANIAHSLIDTCALVDGLPTIGHQTGNLPRISQAGTAPKLSDSDTVPCAMVRRCELV